MKINIILALFAALLVLPITGFAQQGITFPISELGNCANFAECKDYCDSPANQNACIEFAKKNNMKYSNVQRSEPVQSGSTQPASPVISYPIAELDNCASESTCREYCSKSENSEKCIAFAESKGFMTKQQAQDAKKVAKRWKESGGPGDCKTEQECRQYCENPSNHNTCIEFAKESGYITDEQANRAKKLGPNFKGPGGCESRDACQKYCDEHMNECVAFAEENGMMSKEDAERAKKFSGLQNGPGGCKGMQQCREYCENPDNTEACMNWAVENGMASSEEVQKFKKFREAFNNGPGGCKGQEQCQAYCSSEDHMEECMEFFRSSGLMSDEDYARYQQFKRQMLENMPQACKDKGFTDMKQCMEFCQSSPQECAASSSGFAGFGSAPDVSAYLPAACKEAGITDGKACGEFCGEDPEKCPEFNKMRSNPSSGVAPAEFENQRRQFDEESQKRQQEFEERRKEFEQQNSPSTNTNP